MAAEISVLEQKSEVIVLSKQEAAQMLGISLRTIDRLIALKELQVRRLGRRVVIPRASLASFLRTDHPTHVT